MTQMKPGLRTDYKLAMRQVGLIVLQKVTRLSHWLLKQKKDLEMRRNLILKRCRICFKPGMTTGLRRGLEIHQRPIGLLIAQ